MKMPPFEYHAPSDIEEVLELLAEFGDEAKIIAGGQSLVPMLAMRLARPSQLVDINGVSGLSDIGDRGDVLAFGATVRERHAEVSDAVAANIPVLAEALPLIGHVSIRNRGTIGGSIAHADASAELPAVALLADAQIVARSLRGQRVIDADEFFVSHFTSALADDECVVEVRMPKAPPGAGSAFYEVARRHGDFALVGAAVMLSIGPAYQIVSPRICLFGVGDRPLRATATEMALEGEPPSPVTFAAAAAEVAASLQPASDVHGSGAYRRQLAEVTVRRALGIAAGRTTAMALSGGLN